MKILKSTICYLFLLFITELNAQSAAQAAAKPNPIARFFPFILLVGIIYFAIVKPLNNKKKDSSKEKKIKMEKTMSPNQEAKSMSGIIPYIGSIIVIISFFLPWVGNRLGPQLVGNSFEMFEMAEYSSRFLLLGIFLLLFLISPIICHIIISIKYYNNNYINKSLALTPLAIWIVEILIAIISSSDGGDFSMPIGNGPGFGIGAIGTLIGMVITIYLVLSEKVLTSEVIKQVTTNEIQFCPNCGSKLEEYSKFCPECGTDLEKDD